jgi:hypothetical protein
MLWDSVVCFEDVMFVSDLLLRPSSAIPEAAGVADYYRLDYEADIGSS